MKITFIGAGNVAWNLSQVFFQKNIEIKQVFSRKFENAELLSSKINAQAINNFNEINDADIFVISVSDNALSEICENKILKEKINNKLVIHTSGSVDMQILENLSEDFGVFYPLQTFTKNKKVNFKEIPICIEANNTTNEEILLKIAHEISENIQKISSEQRKYIHLSAVFACNFVNNMFAVSDEILSQQNIDFNILRPLILETVSKISDYQPSEIQTGPAVRNDTKILAKHKKMLNFNQNFQDLYNLISENIFSMSNKNAGK